MPGSPGSTVLGGVQVRNSAWIGVEGRQTRVEECVGMKAGETFLPNVCHFVTFSSLSYLHSAISFSKTDAQGLRLLEWQIFFSPFHNSPHVRRLTGIISAFKSLREEANGFEVSLSIRNKTRKAGEMAKWMGKIAVQIWPKFGSYH